MKTYKIANKNQKTERYVVAKSKKEAKKCCFFFQDVVTLVTSEKEFNDLYVN